MSKRYELAKEAMKAILSNPSYDFMTLQTIVEQGGYKSREDFVSGWSLEIAENLLEKLGVDDHLQR
jgi:hypothetical protein